MIDKKLTTLTVAAALIGAVSVAAAVAPNSAHAAGKVKCYGIAKAGENDCANAAGTHSCAGHSTVSFDGGEWQLASSAENCLDQGGQLEAFEGVNPLKA